MDNDWIARALAMHAALVSPLGAHEESDVLKRAENFVTLIRNFAQAALDKPADPFS